MFTSDSQHSAVIVKPPNDSQNSTVDADRGSNIEIPSGVVDTDPESNIDNSKNSHIIPAATAVNSTTLAKDTEQTLNTSTVDLNKVLMDSSYFGSTLINMSRMLEAYFS